MDSIEFDPVDRITVGAVGEPGKRVFLLQARRGIDVVTLVLEKSQVVSLAEGTSSILNEVGYAAPEPLSETEMAIDENEEPQWRVAEMTLGYEETRSMFVIECQELPVADPLADPLEPVEETFPPARTAKFFLNIDQLAALGLHGLKVAAQGRPICPHCALPMDPDGHFCAATNGHKELRT